MKPITPHLLNFLLEARVTEQYFGVSCAQRTCMIEGITGGPCRSETLTQKPNLLFSRTVSAAD